MATQRRNKRRIWLWTGLTVLVTVIALGIAVAARGNTTKFEPSQLAKAELADIARSVVATGKVQPITKVEVKSKASGIVTRLDVDINDHVHQGQGKGHAPVRAVDPQRHGAVALRIERHQFG